MIVEKDNLDFENNREDFIGITNRIDRLLYGLFPMEQQSEDDAIITNLPLTEQKTP